MSLVASPFAVARRGYGAPSRSSNPRQHVFARASSRRDRRASEDPSSRVRASTANTSGASSSDTTSGKVPGVTEMYVELRELEALAEANELLCVAAAANNVVASECTVAFIDVAESVDEARLAARASGVGAPDDAAVARAAVRKAKKDRLAAIAKAEANELTCVMLGGGAECTVAFNDAYDEAYETAMAKTKRYHSLLRRWIDARKKK